MSDFLLWCSVMEWIKSPVTFHSIQNSLLVWRLICLSPAVGDCAVTYFTKAEQTLKWQNIQVNMARWQLFQSHPFAVSANFLSHLKSCLVPAWCYSTPDWFPVGTDTLWFSDGHLPGAKANVLQSSISDIPKNDHFKHQWVRWWIRT